MLLSAATHSDPLPHILALELDISIVKKNARASMAISAAGMILPFAAGVGVAVPIYREFIDPAKASFGHFLLFVGVAISITAFPVLCRILTELRLLGTPFRTSLTYQLTPFRY